MKIKIERTDKELSVNAGLIIFKEFVEASGLEPTLVGSLPKQKFGSTRNYRKFKQLLLAFQAGAECLDDLARLAEDEGFKAVCGGKVYSPKAFGDFLRSFTGLNCKALNNNLIRLGFSLREQLFPSSKSITIDIDSTTNRQYGKKMEGVEKNYKGISGLDTIQAFDEYGIQYWNDTRPGNTHTATGALEILHAIFSRMPKTKAFENMKRYVRADSGYCKIAFFNSCAVKNANFVVCMRRLMFNPLIRQVNHWHAQDPNDPDRIMFVGGRECEIGETVYKPKNSQHVLRVVLIRAIKVGRENQPIKGDADYDYYGWVTNIGASEMRALNVIKFYRKRGHAENFVRELKNGMDLHHYPCQSLLANKAYGLIAACAYNYMRFMALCDNPRRPQFAKALRNRFVHLPCQVVRHAGQVCFKFMDQHFKEVKRWISYIKTLQSWFAQRLWCPETAAGAL